MTDVVVIGAGGFGREVAQLIRDLQVAGHPYAFSGYVDDAPRSALRIPDTEMLLGPVEFLTSLRGVEVVCAIGAPAVRAQVVARVSDFGMRWATLAHPSARIGARSVIGEGTVICANVIVTVDVRLGKHVHLNLGCTVGHDAVLEDFATLAPLCSVSGAAQLGVGAYLGTNAVVLPKAKIGSGAVVGAGSVVLRTVAPNTTVVGVPARTL